MSQYWKGKVALVSGASAGIGARIAVRLANAGIIVVGLARRTNLIDDLNAEVTGEGKIFSHFCDLREETSILEAFNEVYDKFQVVHILVCNAGIIKASLLTDSSSNELKEVFDLNVYATTICLREGLCHMRTTKAVGHIIVMNSILGHRIPRVAVPLFNVYPATKHAVTALCRTVREEIQFLKLNIKLTSINPGLVDTEFLKVYSQTVDLPKLLAEDVAGAVYFALETPCNVQVEDVTLQAMRRYNEE